MQQVNHWAQVSGSVFTGEGWAEPGRILVAEIPAWRPKSKDYGQNARRGRWGAAKRARAARKKVGDALMVASWPRELPRPDRRYTLTFTVFQEAGKIMDSDNEAGVLKSCRDAVATWLNTDDGPAGPIRWVYASCRGPMDRVVMVLEEVS